MELRITDEAAKALVGNIEAYQEHLDPTDDAEFVQMGKYLSAISMMLDDILIQAGLREPLTALEVKARTANPYHVSILPNEGRKP